MIDAKVCCAICEATRSPDQTWYLVAENPWDDRLWVLAWNDAIARRAGIHCSCSVAHVEQLVAHWMAAGSLECPFAKTSPDARATAIRATRLLSVEPDLTGATRLAEITLCRESFDRALRENPYSFAPMLRALVVALQEYEPTAHIPSPERQPWVTLAAAS